MKIVRGHSGVVEVGKITEGDVGSLLRTCQHIGRDFFRHKRCDNMITLFRIVSNATDNSVLVINNNEYRGNIESHNQQLVMAAKKKGILMLVEK